VDLPTRAAAPSPNASLGRRAVCGRTEQRRPPGTKRYETKVRMVWGSFLIAAAALKTPTRNCCNAQGVNLAFTQQISKIRGCHPPAGGTKLEPWRSRGREPSADCSLPSCIVLHNHAAPHRLGRSVYGPYPSFLL